MNRRDFLKQASLGRSGPRQSRGSAPREAGGFGGIQIECSTYGGILSRMEELHGPPGDELAGLPYFRAAEGLSFRSCPTMLARPSPGGPVERRTYDGLNVRVPERPRGCCRLDGL